MPRVITSFTEHYYNRKGAKEFVDSFRKYWPKSVELVIYYEGDVLRDDEENIKWKWLEEVDEWGVWEKRLSYWPILNGNINGRFEMQTDARQWRKPFMENHSLKLYGGKIFWIDADVVTFDHVPETFLDECLPDDKICCFLGRPTFYTESGFIGFNGKHPLTPHFFRVYLDFFRSGAIFTKTSFHDCMGFDCVREMINRPDLFVDLAEGLPEETMHPFINSVVGKYMDHAKGLRKNTGSWREDLTVERTEEYWKDRKQAPLMESGQITSQDTGLQPAA